MLNRFCLVVKLTPLPQPVLNAWTISRLIKYQPKSNEKYMPFLHWISSFEGNSCKNLKDTATTDLSFLIVFIRRSFYISRYHFSKIFRTSFNIIWKIDFQHEFSIFNKSTQATSSSPSPRGVKLIPPQEILPSKSPSLFGLRHLQLLQKTKIAFDR